jgi:HME family heavy-metal exporter
MRNARRRWRSAVRAVRRALGTRPRRPSGRDLVVRGSLERMTPVLMTALSAGVALVPLLIDAATPGKEILHPVAVTIFGGLVSATLLDAFITFSA